VGRTPSSAAGPPAGFRGCGKGLILQEENGSRGTRADQGVRPTKVGRSGKSQVRSQNGNLAIESGRLADTTGTKFSLEGRITGPTLLPNLRHFRASKMDAMRKPAFLLFLLPAFLPAQAPSLTGHWFTKSDFYGTPINYPMEFKQQGDKFTGEFGGDKLEGTLTGNAVHFLAKDDRGGTEELTGTVQGGAISGTIVFIDGDDKDHPSTHKFTATPVPQRRSGPPQRHEFTPSVFYRQFSPTNAPVLTVSPGDTIHTTTVDAGGTDEKGRASSAAIRRPDLFTWRARRPGISSRCTSRACA
jgi:hypothetical protein